MDGGEEFEWVDYTEFNMDNWARDQPDQVSHTKNESREHLHSKNFALGLKSAILHT